MFLGLPSSLSKSMINKLIKGCKMSILNLCVWDLYMLTIWMLKTRVLRVLEFLYQNWNLHEIYFRSWHLWSPFTREIFLRWQFVKTFQKFKLRSRNCAHRSPCKTSCFMVRKPQIDKVNSWTLQLHNVGQRRFN